MNLEKDILQVEAILKEFVFDNMQENAEAGLENIP
jgi:hypothetical protein